MKIKINRADLLEGIQAVQNVIPTRATLPVLSNFLFETQKDHVRIVATDLDLGISKNIPAEIQEEGAITIPAKRFGEIARELPEEEVNIAVKKNNSIHVNCGTCFFKLMGIATEEFPKIPKIETEQNLILEQKELKEMLELTSFAVSHDEARYVLNGIFFDVKDKTVNLVATDGRRLSVIKKNNLEKAGNIQMIVPVKTIQELLRLLKDEGKVKIIYNENQVCFELNGTLIISRLIEGEFPNYAQVIPEEKKTKITIKREAFLRAVKRASLFTTTEAPSIKLEVFKDKMVISKIVPEIGEAREELPMDYAGKDFAVGFNPYYLIDVLKNLKEEEVPFEIEDGDKPGVIRLPNYTHIVLPMQLS